MKITELFLSVKKTLYFYWIGARIKTLTACLMPLIMTQALLIERGFFDIPLFSFTALSLIFIQIAVNLFNDAFDGKEDLDSSSRIGPARLLGSGQLSFSQVQFMAFFSCFMACLFAFPLVIRGGFPILIMGVTSLFMTYFYTSSRYSLLKLGLSELSAILFFGFFIVFGVYYLQALTWEFSLIYLSLQCGFWALSLLLINHLRDEMEDKKKGRKTFVTLYGRIHSLFFLAGVQAFIYLLCFYWMNLGFKAGAFSFFVLPFSIVLIYLVANKPASKEYNNYLAFCSFSYVLFAFSWVAGFLL